jgi:hypothetical protein
MDQMTQITVPTMTAMFGDLFETGGCVPASPMVSSLKEGIRTFCLNVGKDNLKLLSEFDGSWNRS